MATPLEDLYDAFWTMLEASSDFTTAVPAGNRIKHTGTDRWPRKTGSLPADFPQVRIVMAGMVPHLERTSDGSSLTVQWAIQVRSGDQRFDTVQQLAWYIYRALLGWETYLKNALTWNGAYYVRRCRAMMVRQEDDPQDDIRGWTDTWACETDLWFRTAQLEG